jgi:hypothetical protein
MIIHKNILIQILLYLIKLILINLWNYHLLTLKSLNHLIIIKIKIIIIHSKQPLIIFINKIIKNKLVIFLQNYLNKEKYLRNQLDYLVKIHWKLFITKKILSTKKKINKVKKLIHFPRKYQKFHQHGSLIIIFDLISLSLIIFLFTIFIKKKFRESLYIIIYLSINSWVGEKNKKKM